MRRWPFFRAVAICRMPGSNLPFLQFEQFAPHLRHHLLQRPYFAPDGFARCHSRRENSCSPRQ